MRRILSGIIALGLAVALAALCAQSATAQDAVLSVLFGVLSGANLVTAMGHVAIYMGERAETRAARVASGSYGSAGR